jgi:hypothetical protein
MTLSGFSTGDSLELYYDIARGQQDIGYISKGWEDPGFRIGDLIQIPKRRAAQFRSTIKQIRKLCAVNGIGVTVERTKDTIEIQVDGVIYNEGFSKKTFKKTLETLNECVQNIRQMTA